MKVTKEGLELNKYEYVIVNVIIVVTSFALFLGLFNLLLLDPVFRELFERATRI